MPISKLPVTDLDNINHRRRARETLNQVLDHSFDDSRRQTKAEKLAGVTPVNYAYIPGDLRRYKAEPFNFDSTTEDWTDAIQAAMDTNNEVYFPAPNVDGNFYGISRPLYIRDGQHQNLTLVGNRTNTYLHPLAVDIKDATTVINAMLFNQAGDRKFSVRNLRFWSGVSYTGQVLYCVEGGGADASGQTVFSGSIDNCWFGLSSQNSGMLEGGFQNYRITNNVWEFCKRCIILNGVGNGDIQIVNNQCFFCYDAFVEKTDSTNIANLVTIDNTHIYAHQRGFAFPLRLVYGLSITNAQIQMDIAGNLGDGGLFSLREVTDFTIGNFQAITDATLGTGDLDEVILIQGCTGKFVNGVINGASIGIKFTGNDTNRVSFTDVDVLSPVGAAFQVQTGTPTGRVELNHCDFSNGTASLVVFTSNADFDFIVNNCRFVNAGLGGVAGSRNLSLSTNGVVQIINCTIGQNTGSAAANHYITAVGSGTVEIIHPTILGTPPTALKTGAQAVQFVYKPGLGTAISSVAAISLPYASDVFPISGTTNITSMDATFCEGRRVTLIFQDILTFTDGSNLKLSANFVTTADDTITLVSDGTNWHETARSVN